jgi:hypothetical protein
MSNRHRLLCAALWLAVMGVAGWFLKSWYIPTFGEIGFIAWMLAILGVAWLIDRADRNAAEQSAGPVDPAGTGRLWHAGGIIEMPGDRAGMDAIDGPGRKLIGGETGRHADRAADV